MKKTNAWQGIFYTPKGIIMEPTTLSKHVKDMRKQYNLT